MKVTTTELSALLENAAGKVVGSEDARYFAEETVETEIRKHHRSDPLKSAINDLVASVEKKDVSLSYEVDLPSYLAINFNGHGPLTYLKKVHDELEERSEKNGMAMVAFKNSKSMHTLHAWVQGLAKRGMLAIAVCNGGPAAVVPFNGTKGLFGTNPMAFGFPGEGGEISCVDMATSEIPYFEILDANKEGKPLRERSAVDKNGEFTTNPKEALDFYESETDPVSNIVPMGGGYKGYYLIFLLELLTSGLIGMPSSPEMSSDFVPEEHGAILIAFNMKAFGTNQKFAHTVQALHTELREQTPKQGSEIPLPGERDNERMKEFDGTFEVDNALIEKLKALQ